MALNWLCLCAGVFSLDSARLSPLFQAAPSVTSGPSTPVSVHQDLLSGSPVHEPATLCPERGPARSTGTLLMGGLREHAAPVVGARHSQQGRQRWLGTPGKAACAASEIACWGRTLDGALLCELLGSTRILGVDAASCKHGCCMLHHKMWLTSDSSLQEGPSGRTTAAMRSQGANSEQLGDMRMVVSTSESAPKTSVHISVTFPGQMHGSDESARGQAGLKSQPVASSRPQPSPGKPCMLLACVPASLGASGP